MSVNVQELTKIYGSQKAVDQISFEARPGEVLANRNMDVVQALSIAGGMTPYAAANKIKILRSQNGKLSAIPFRYGEIEKGENLQQNIILRSGDVVLVP